MYIWMFGRIFVSPYSVKLYREELIVWRSARSSGPGGQHVNTSNSKAELLYTVKHLNEKILHLVRRKRPSLVSKDHLIISSQKYRSLSTNQKDCIETFVNLLDRAEEELKPHETQPEKIEKIEKIKNACKERRLEAKRLHSEKKNSRRINKNDFQL